MANAIDAMLARNHDLEMAGRVHFEEKWDRETGKLEGFSEAMQRAENEVRAEEEKKKQEAVRIIVMELPEIAAVLVEKAKGGSVSAMIECLNRAMGKPKVILEGDMRVSVEPTPMDYARAAQIVIQAQRDLLEKAKLVQALKAEAVEGEVVTIDELGV